MVGKNYELGVDHVYKTPISW